VRPGPTRAPEGFLAVAFGGEAPRTSREAAMAAAARLSLAWLDRPITVARAAVVVDVVIATVVLGNPASVMVAPSVVGAVVSAVCSGARRRRRREGADECYDAGTN
jgi:hypothetical protein